MKFHRIKAIAYKEFTHLFRDIRSLLILILVPILLLILFGYTLKLDVENVSTFIIDHSKSTASKEYINKFSASYAFKLESVLDNENYAMQKLNTKEAKLVLVIPASFAEDIEEMGKSSIQAIIDASDIIASNSILSYLNAVNNSFNMAIIENYAIKHGVASKVGYAQPNMRFYFNETQKSVNFLFPGLIVVITSVVAGFLTSLSISKEWELGTMERLIPTPLKEDEIIIGKLIAYFFIGFIDILIYIILGALLFNIYVPNNPFLLLLSSVLFLTNMLLFGIFISIIMKTQLASSQLAISITLIPAFLLSGFIFDINNMPHFIQLITFLFPARYFLDILKTLYLKGGGFEYIYQNIALLIIYVSVISVLCKKLFKMRI